MLYDKLKKNLDHSSFIREYDDVVDQGSSVQYYHMNQSARTLLAARAWDRCRKNILIISQDDIMAEDIWDDLCVLIGREHTGYLPDYEILPYEERSPHYSIRATRMETLLGAMSSAPKVYSLSIRSLLRWIIPRETIARHIITIKIGMEYAPEQLVQDLVNNGYEVEYQVSKIFQVSRRGGILDVYSPPSQKPYRIEYFGDEITSIRQFSVSTQRSEAHEIPEIVLIPSRELSIDDIDTGSPIISKIRDKGFFEGIENYYSLLVPRLQTFADYFEPSELLIYWNNLTYILEEAEQVMEQAFTQYSKLLRSSNEKKLSRPEKMIADTDYLRALIAQTKSFFVSQSEFLLPMPVPSIAAPFEAQNSFNGDLVKLSEELNSYRRQGFDTMLLFDNESQSRRMQQLLDDYDVLTQQHLGVLHAGFRLDNAKLAVYTDHEIFNRYKRKRYAPRFAAGQQVVDYQNLKPGDYVVHIDHGVGVFEGLRLIRLDGQDIECLCIRYAEEDKVYVPTFQLQLVSRYVAEEGSNPVLHKLGSTKWQNTKTKAKKQIEIIAADIVSLYAERSKRLGVAHIADTPWQKELEESFIYEDTPDQIRATAEIKQDLELPVPMERLLCGDVGFGKTEVAIRAAFKVVTSGYQVAILVPTTLLAEQHYRVFRERLAQYPVRIAMFSRFRTAAQVTKDLAGLALGQIDIAIGTHRIISKDVNFKKLGLLIIDEEHRFGVRHKEKIRRMQSNVDTLYMSATPIPRTLNMALAKLKEISLMQTSPKERLPIRTIITPRDTEVIKDAIRREVDRGGQVFFIHNRVQTIETVA
ncbi:MAG: transcription-repair coupling factor, partial [Candidatus Cloacimonetes bacterium HGW-Cloacimonetes-1]